MKKGGVSTKRYDKNKKFNTFLRVQFKWQNC